MSVKFENYGRFYCTVFYAHNYVNECYDGSWPRSLKECAEYIKRNMDNDNHIILGMICDWDTGETVISFTPDEEDIMDDYNDET